MLNNSRFFFIYRYIFLFSQPLCCAARVTIVVVKISYKKSFKILIHVFLNKYFFIGEFSHIMYIVDEAAAVKH